MNNNIEKYYPWFDSYLAEAGIGNELPQNIVKWRNNCIFALII